MYRLIVKTLNKNNKTTRYSLWAFLFLHLFVLGKAQGGTPPLSRFLKPTVALKVDTVYAIPVQHRDGFANDTLYQAVSDENLPVYYYRPVLTEVCQDGECRPLRLTLYWNVTGRYLGFKLPVDEFLSKKDHEPFQEGDYQRLNTLLADSLSPLANVHKEDLATALPFAAQGLDAVTGATSRDISGDVVAGAAYTTYTLWHLIYGETQDDILRQTEKRFSLGLVSRILDSEDVSDKLWALNRLKRHPTLVEPLWNRLLSLIDDANFTLAERAIRVLEAKELRSPLIQERLVNKFFESDHSLKLLIVDKLKEAPELNDKAREQLTGHLPALRGELLSDVFELYKEKHVSDDRTCEAVAVFLDDKNKFVSRRAYDFLAYVRVNNRVIQKKMANYRSAQRL